MALCQSEKYCAGRAFGTDCEPAPKRPNRAGIFMLAHEGSRRNAPWLPWSWRFSRTTVKNNAEFNRKFQIVKRERRNRRTAQSRREAQQQNGPVANCRGRSVLDQQVGDLTQFGDIERTAASRPLGALPLSAAQELYRKESPRQVDSGELMVVRDGGQSPRSAAGFYGFRPLVS